MYHLRLGLRLLLVATICLCTKYSAGQGHGDRLVLDPRLAPFYHGVASGDPLSDRVILWTRVTTEEPVVYGIWRIATDSLFTDDLQEGIFSTSAASDYTVKVDASNLEPDTWYFYEFEALGKRSVRGRTKTTPVHSTDDYRIVFISCSDFNTGYFNVYSRIRERNDFEVVYHMGDYIYEYEDSRYIASGLKIRDIEPLNETITLTDYRTRYSFYRLDPELRKLHQQYPWVLIWDDHETANDSWVGGSPNHNIDLGEGSWNDRKSAGAQAYLEWMPIRTNDSGNPLEIYRSFDVGNLATFYLLENRLTYRSNQDIFIATFPQFDDPNRGILGPEQLNWLKSGLLNQQPHWRIVVSPVLFSTLIFSLDPSLRSGDLWDGYPLQRKQIINHLEENNIANFVALSGDLHMALGMDIPSHIENPSNTQFYDPVTGEGSVGVNFLGTAVSSVPCCSGADTAELHSINPQMKFINVKQNGYCVLDVTPDLITCDYYFVDAVNVPGDSSNWWGGSLCVQDSASHLQRCDTASVGNMVYYPMAPCWPRAGGDTILPVSTHDFLGDITGVYPIPAAEAVGIQFFIQQGGIVDFEIIDLSGKLLLRESSGLLERGIHYKNIILTGLPPGNYILTIRAEDGRPIASRQIVRM